MDEVGAQTEIYFDDPGYRKHFLLRFRVTASSLFLLFLRVPEIQ